MGGVTMLISLSSNPTQMELYLCLSSDINTVSEEKRENEL